jgi:hypothetical protein
MKSKIGTYQNLLDEFYSKKAYSSLIKSDAQSVFESFTYIENTLNNSLNEQNDQLEQIKTGIIAQILSLTFLSLECLKQNKTGNILREDYPANDYQLSAHLIEISNTQTSILQLCSNGFDLQARILLRNLEERLMQIIILFTHEHDFTNWSSAQESEESKTTYYDIFTKKGSLFKKYGVIEKEILQGFGVNSNREQELNLRAFRKERSDNLSMSVHGASAEVYLRSFNLSNNDIEEVIPSLVGVNISYSLEIVSETFTSMWYFLKLFRLLLFKYHNWEQDFNNENIIAFEFYRFINQKTMIDIVDRNEQ